MRPVLRYLFSISLASFKTDLKRDRFRDGVGPSVGIADPK
jgi:hypothetical protein